jgi:TolB-like protein/Flp pilus assembly protein TadD
MTEHSAESTRRVRFATFELDLHSRELHDGTRRVRLQEQPFEILKMMLERPGEVVTRDELRRRLWPHGTFVDFEHGLNAAVKRLRAALGDDAENPRFVETLPRRGYRFIAQLDRESAARAGNGTPKHQPEIRLAVLPFTNLSGDPAQEYFSDGLTEELIAQLGTTGRGRIGVIARWSSMVFKGTSQRAREIGDTLQAGYLLEGSVRFDGERLRITARLIHAATETQLWSESYERELSKTRSMTSGTLSVQTDVASRVARSLALELVPSAVSLDATPTLAGPAYQSYLKGRYHWNNRGPEGIDDALAHFSRLVAQEPAFGAGHAAIARAHVALAEYYRGVPRVALERAAEAAHRAVALDPESAEAHLALGDVQRRLRWDWRSAESEYSRALRLNPSCDPAHRSYGVMLAALGRSDEAIREVDRACELDPLCFYALLAAAWIRYAAGDYEHAVERCRQIIDVDPGRVAAYRQMAAALLQCGLRDEAIAALETSLTMAPDDTVALAWLAHARAIVGDSAAARTLVQQLQSLGRYVSPYNLALAHTGIGDLDTAFATLDEAFVDRDPMLENITIEPRFQPLRQDARYETLRTLLSLGARAYA